MSGTTAAGTSAEVAAAGAAGFRQRFRRRPVAIAAAALLAFVVLVSLGADVLMPHDPNMTVLAHANAGPSVANLLGTDDLGRDVLSRVILGGRVSLFAAATAVIVALAVGLPLGLISGYFGGLVDSAIMRTNDALMSFPALMLAVTIVGILGPSLRNAMLAIGIVYAPRIMRVVRGSALSIREENYVVAARALGVRHASILLRHVLPNLLSPLIVQATVMFGTAILFEASLSFLGLGVQPPQPSWGAILGRAFPYISRSPVIVIFVGALLSAVILAINLLGDELRDTLGPEKWTGRTNPKAPCAPVRRSTGNLLDVWGLSVSFPGPHGPVPVLDGVDLCVDRNEIVCLVGESGSGKSVAAMTAIGLTRYAGALVDAGSIRFEGEELIAADNARFNRLRGSEVGFIFQEPMTSLNPAFTIGDQIGEVLRRHRKFSRKAARQRATELLEMVGLSDPQRRVDDYPHHLSGGMRQRAMIAIAIAARPKLLIADEPTTALDLTVQATILELIQRLREDLNMAVLLITHDFGVVAEMADRVVVMYAGQVIESAPAGALFNRPRHPYTSGLLASLPQMSSPGKTFQSIPGVVPVAGRMPGGCRFHPRCAYAVREVCTLAPIPIRHGDGFDVRCARSEDLRLEGT